MRFPFETNGDLIDFLIENPTEALHALNDLLTDTPEEGNAELVNCIARIKAKIWAMKPGVPGRFTIKQVNTIEFALKRELGPAALALKVDRKRVYRR